MTDTMQRRRFLKHAGVLAGMSVLPARAIAGSEANSAVSLGLIGSGGRGQWIADIFTKQTNARITALHDLFDDRLSQGAQKFGVPDGKKFKGLQAYKDLLNAGVEGVLIESPPYCHPEQALAAVEAGKHVYMAKPVAVDTAGCKDVIRGAELATQKKVNYLVDFQTRTHDFYKEAIRRVHEEGGIGTPVCGQIYYHAGRLGRQAVAGASAEENRMREWVYDKALSGDILVEQNVHVLDVCNWILGTRPLAAYGTGGRKARVDVGDCWDHFIVTFYYPNDVKIDFSSNQFSKGYGDLCARVYGSGGTIDTHYEGNVTITGDKPFPGGSTQGLYYSGALTNARAFVQGIESGKLVNNGAEAAQSTQTCVLGRTAAYRQKEVTWDEVEKANERLDLKIKL